MEALSSLRFEIETAHKIRVVDPNLHPKLVGMIGWNPALGRLEMHPNANYPFSQSDIRKIEAFIANFDVENPKL